MLPISGDSVSGSVVCEAKLGINMKLLCVLMVCILAMSSAEEHPRGKMIQVCGAELARAMKRVCEDGDLDFFNLQHVQHHHQHDHDHKHDHQQGNEHHEWKEQAVKRDTSTSLADQCCAKPCHVKDFVSYCP